MKIVLKLIFIFLKIKIKNLFFSYFMSETPRNVIEENNNKKF